MPYFERQSVLETTLLSFAGCGYFQEDGLRIQVSLCDDGSIKEKLYKVPALKVIPNITSSLPEKREWKCPTVPLNRAVEQTSTPLIVIQSPETKHMSPLILPMFQRMDTWKDVVMAPVKAGGQKIERGWCAHPQHAPNTLWWCHMMSRDMWEHIDGMDESFRELYAGEDNDLAIRLRKAGAQFKWLPEEVGYAVNTRTKKIQVTDRQRRHAASMKLLEERHGPEYGKSLIKWHNT
jgi:hypothetical protein